MLLDFIFDLFIKAQTLLLYMISNILIWEAHNIFDTLHPVKTVRQSLFYMEDNNNN